MVEVDQQQRAATPARSCPLEVLLGALGEQQTIRQVDQWVVVGELVEFLPRAFQRREVGEHRYVMAEITLVVVDAAQVLPLRIHLAVLAAVPDFAAPFAMIFQRQPHLSVEGCVVLAGGEEFRCLPEYLFGAVAGDATERGIDVHDVLAWISYQNAFLGAVEDRSRLFKAGFLHMLSTLLLVEAAKVLSSEHEQQGARECHK